MLTNQKGRPDPGMNSPSPLGNCRFPQEVLRITSEAGLSKPLLCARDCSLSQPGSGSQTHSCLQTSFRRGTSLRSWPRLLFKNKVYEGEFVSTLASALLVLKCLINVQAGSRPRPPGRCHHGRLAFPPPQSLVNTEE